MEGIFRFKMVWLDNKKSRWAYIWEGLLSEGHFRLRFGGLLFGGLIFFFLGGGCLLSEFYGILLLLSLLLCYVRDSGEPRLGNLRRHNFHTFLCGDCCAAHLGASFASCLCCQLCRPKSP